MQPRTNTTLLNNTVCLLGLILLLALLVFSRAASAQTPPETRFWVTDGTVNSIVTNAASIFVGGDFDYVGPNTGLGTTLNASDASLIPQNASHIDHDTGEIYTVISDGLGGWFVGGSFQKVDGKDHPYLIHIGASGFLNSQFEFQPNNSVHALQLSHDKRTLYIGGEFNNIASTPRSRIAAISLPDPEDENNDTYELLDWNPSIDNGQVKSFELTSDDTTLFVGGSFTSVNGDSTTQRIIALDTASGTTLVNWTPAAPTPFIPPSTGSVNALELKRDDTLLYLGGDFNDITGVATTRNRAAALNLDTDNAFAPSLSTTWNPNLDAEVHTMHLNAEDDFVYLGGNFTNIGGVDQSYLARVSTTDSLVDVTWAPQIDAQVRTLVFDDFRANTTNPTEKFYFGGDFTQVSPNATDSPSERFYIARFDMRTENTLLDTWAPNATGRINSLALQANASEVFAGGNFFSIGGIRQSYLTEITSGTGTANEFWRPNINAPIDHIEVSGDGSYVYIAGDFDLVDNKPRNKLARFTTFNAEVDNWAPNIENGNIYTMALAKIGFSINHIAIEPANSQRLYAATENGLYVSNDAGESWSSNTSLGGKIVRKVLPDPNRPTTVYASIDEDGIFRSNDRGLSWTPINTGLSNTTVRDIAITSDSSRIYIATDIIPSPTIIGELDGGIFISENSGNTWTRLVRTDSHAIAIDPIDDNRIYFGTATGFFISERTIPENKTEYEHTFVDCIQNNNTVDPCNNGLDIDVNVTDIVVSLEHTDDTPPASEESEENDDAEQNTKPKHATVIYVISNGILFKTEDSAESWRVPEGLPEAASVTSVAVNPDVNSANVVYASVTGHGVFKSENSTLSWQQANNGLTSPLVNHISIDPNNVDTVYTSATLGIIQKTTNGAEIWTDKHFGIPNDVLYIGGNFFGSHPEFLAAIDTSTQSGDFFLNWDALSNNEVHSLSLSPDNATLYAGGSFTNIGSNSNHRIAALNATTAQALWDSNNISIDDGVVKTLALSEENNRLYFGGTFQSTTPSSDVKYLGAVNTSDGALITDWVPNVNNNVSAIRLFNSDKLLVVGGVFNEIDENPRNFLASLSTTIPEVAGNTASSPSFVTGWEPNPNADILSNQAITVSGKLVYIGGDFTRIDDEPLRTLTAYTFVQPEVKASPISGSFDNDIDIEITCSAEEERTCFDIFHTTSKNLDNATWSSYRVDNSIPANSVPQPIVERNIDTSTTLSFFSIDTEGVASDIITETYIIDIDRPTVDIILPSGKYTRTFTSKLECEDGNEDSIQVSGCSEIFYTLDGSDPSFVTSISTGDTTQKVYTETGTTVKYRDDTPVPIRATSTLRVIGVDSAGNISREMVGEYVVVRGEGSGSLGIYSITLLLLTFLTISFLTKGRTESK